MKFTLRKRIFVVFLTLAMLLIPLCETLTPTAEAATKAATNKKAKKLYKKKVKELSKEHKGVSYKFMDVNKDGIIDVIIDYLNGNGAAWGNTFEIYTYKKGKLVKLLSTGGYFLEQMYVYKNGIVVYGDGRGREYYEYYKKTKTGKYQYVGEKYRRVYDVYEGLAWGEWSYSDKSGEIITKTAFKKLTKKVTSGKRKAVY